MAIRERASVPVLVLSAVLLAVSFLVLIYRTGDIDAFWQRAPIDKIRHETGFAYMGQTNHPELSSDQHPSPARVLENGVPLPGPANSLHADIRAKGNGRYAFWHESIYFSASDNSDPTMNHRIYEISYPFSVSDTVAYAVYAAAFLASVLSYFLTREKIPWIPLLRTNAGKATRLLGSPPGFYAICGSVLVYMNYAVLSGTPILACLAPDSWGYLTVNTMRSQGYQLFLTGIVAAFGDLRWAGPVQLNLELISLIALAWAIRDLFRSALVGYVVLAVLMLDTQLLTWFPEIMTEALFVALVGFHFAAVARLLARYSAVWAILAGATLAAMMVEHPSGLSLLAGLPLLVLFLRHHRRAVVLCVVGPLVVVFLLQSTYNYYAQGFFGLNLFTGVSLLGKYAQLVRGDMPTQYPNLASTLEKNLKPLYAAYPDYASRSFPAEYSRISTATVTDAMYRHAIPVVTAYVEQKMPGASPTAKAMAVDQISRSLTISAIRSDPIGAVMEISSSYWAYWARESFAQLQGVNMEAQNCLTSSTQLFDAAPQSFEAMLDPRPYRDPAIIAAVHSLEPGTPRPIERPWLWLIQNCRWPLRIAAFLFSLVGIVSIAFYRRLGSGALFLGYISFELHSSYGLLSAANAAFERYASPQDILLILIILVGMTVCCRALLRRLFPEPLRPATVEPSGEGPWRSF